MVSENPSSVESSFLERIVEWVSSLPLLSRGAESELRLGLVGGIQAVFKYRRRKLYMDPQLDARLRRHRTFKEARILVRARRAGIRVPRLLLFLPEIYLLVIEYIHGIKLKDFIVSRSCDSSALDFAREAGVIVGSLHELGISHGDPTTSNFIISNNNLYIIDFGLSEITFDIEDFAVDLHLFKRAVLSTHPQCPDELYSSFITGYLAVRGPQGDPVIERARQIELRGRYVEERRSVWRL